MLGVGGPGPKSPPGSTRDRELPIPVQYSKRMMYLIPFDLIISKNLFHIPGEFKTCVNFLSYGFEIKDIMFYWIKPNLC